MFLLWKIEMKFLCIKNIWYTNVFSWWNNRSNTQNSIDKSTQTNWNFPLCQNAFYISPDVRTCFVGDHSQLILLQFLSPKLPKRSYPNVLKSKLSKGTKWKLPKRTKSRLSKGNKIQTAQTYQIKVILMYQKQSYPKVLD